MRSGPRAPGTHRFAHLSHASPPPPHTPWVSKFLPPCLGLLLPCGEAVWGISRDAKAARRRKGGSGQKAGGGPPRQEHAQERLGPCWLAEAAGVQSAQMKTREKPPPPTLKLVYGSGWRSVILIPPTPQSALGKNGWGTGDWLQTPVCKTWPSEPQPPTHYNPTASPG